MQSIWHTICILYRNGQRFCWPHNDRIMAISDRILTDGSTVRARREARQWTQAELASRAGISRTAVSAIEGALLTPSVATALALARVFECSVEELFAVATRPLTIRAEWVWPPGDSSGRYWQAEMDGQIKLYPVEAVGLNPVAHDGLWSAGRPLEVNSPLPEKTLVLASCDPAAGLLAAEYARQTGFRLLVFPRGGRAALELLQQRRVHVAALHFATDETPERNAALVRERVTAPCTLLRSARWQSGVALGRGRTPGEVAAPSRQRLRWAAREPGSAARECLDELLGRPDFDGREVGGHNSVAEAVRSGWADAGVCVRFSATEAGLDFLPLRTEDLDFCFLAARRADPRIQALLRVVRSRSWRRLLGELPGYDIHETGALAPL